MSTSDSPNPFPPTRWSLIARASADDEVRRGRALEELCQLYWPPIFTFIRSKGASIDEAEDLTQGFFADFLARDSFRSPRRELGKLRTYLLTSVTHYMTNDWRNRNRLKRGGGVVVISIDPVGSESGGLLIPCENQTPEALFDRQWAITLLSEVLQALRKRYTARGQEHLFNQLKQTIQPGSPSVDYPALAKELAMTESALKVAAHRLRKRYGALLRETIADTLIEGEDVETELRALMQSFS